jgi:hypothetical protein
MLLLSNFFRVPLCDTTKQVFVYLPPRQEFRAFCAEGAVAKGELLKIKVDKL